MHSFPEGSKISRYDSCKQVMESSSIMPVEMSQMPDMPDECTFLWDAFTRLSSCSYTEIKAYIELTGDCLGRWEIDAIIQLNKVRANPPTRFQWLKKSR